MYQLAFGAAKKIFCMIDLGHEMNEVLASPNLNWTVVTREE